MEHKNLNSLNVEGLGTYAGGEFDRVNISGKGTITGDLTCRLLDISGMSTIQGSVTCERIRTSGMGKIHKNVITDEIDISGTMEFFEDVETKSLHSTGMTKIQQCLKSTSISSTGMLTVEGDLNSEEFKLDGMLKCSGFLNCESLELTSRGTSKLNEVGATNIKLTAPAHSINNFLSFFLPDFLKESKVIANVIEGDHVYLENCEVKIVRGKDIQIGPKCRIGLIEHSGTCDVHPDSTVDQINQL